MKKFYKNIFDLMSNNNDSVYEDALSGYEVIYSYLTSYYEDSKCLEPLSLDDQLGKYLNTNLTGYAKMNSFGELAININTNDNKTLNIIYECHIPTELSLKSSNYKDVGYRDGDIDLFKDILYSTLVEYIKDNQNFHKNYTSTHDGIHALNFNCYFYIIKNTAILFLPGSAYIDITFDNDNNCLIYNKHNMPEEFNNALEGNEERLLKKLYIETEELPNFLKEKLNIDEIDKPIKKVRNLFTRK